MRVSPDTRKYTPKLPDFGTSGGSSDVGPPYIRYNGLHLGAYVSQLAFKCKANHYLVDHPSNSKCSILLDTRKQSGHAAMV